MTNLTADGQTAIGANPGKQVVVAAFGDFGGGTIAIQVSDGTNWHTLPGGSFSADFHEAFLAPECEEMRANLAGATSPDIEFSSIEVRQ